MPRVEVSAAANRDLDGIYDFGVARFGIDSAQRYAEKMTAAMNRLAEFPSMGEAVPDRQPPLRAFGCESHVIYYRDVPHGVFVTRVLHMRMDARRYV